jgi:hypothetical protein
MGRIKSAAISKKVKPVAKLIPADSNKHPDDLFGFMKGKVKIVGDIIAPAFSPEEWGDLYFDPLPRRRRR